MDETIDKLIGSDGTETIAKFLHDHKFEIKSVAAVYVLHKGNHGLAHSYNHEDTLELIGAIEACKQLLISESGYLNISIDEDLGDNEDIDLER